MSLKRIIAFIVILSMIMQPALCALTVNAEENTAPVLWYEFDV